MLTEVVGWWFMYLEHCTCTLVVGDLDGRDNVIRVMSEVGCHILILSHSDIVNSLGVNFVDIN